MVFMYYDRRGKQIQPGRLCELEITTPAIEHVIATVRERIIKSTGMTA